jgi:hypothetical protein
VAIVVIFLIGLMMYCVVSCLPREQRAEYFYRWFVVFWTKKESVSTPHHSDCPLWRSKTKRKHRKMQKKTHYTEFERKE